jgi:hypothetical protein
MRKIKIFLTTLAVAGVLFATTSCVDNTESESVSALRNAKAAELNALAQHYKDDDANNKILAEAQALVARANADLLASQTVLAASQVKLNEANAQAILLQAEAEKLRAEGDKAVSEARAKQLEALADQIVKQAQADADAAAEALRSVKYDNDLKIADLQWAVAKAEIAAKKDLLEQQNAYIQAVKALGISFIDEHNTLIGLKTNVLNDITDLKAGIAELELANAGIQSDLALYSIDSARFVTRYRAQLQRDLTIDSLQLKYAERNLALWESFDTGLEGLEAAKAVLINDTLEKTETLALAVATAAELEADTVTKAEELAAAEEAFEPVEAAYDAANEAVAVAQEDYNAYLGLTVSGYYALGSLIETSYWTYTATDNGIAGYGPNYWTRAADGRTYYAPLNPYNYSDYQTVTVYSDKNIEVRCLIDLDYPIAGEVDYLFRVYTKVLVPNTYEALYTSAEDYEHHIQLWKQDSIDAKKVYEDISKRLSDSLVSLKALGALERTLYNQLQDSIAGLTAAAKAETDTYAAYIAAKDKYELDFAAANLPAVDAARVAYEGRKYDNTVVPAANGGAVAAHARAITYRTNAQNKYNNAQTAYNNTNGSIHGLIDGVIAANNAVALVNAKLAPAYDNLVILKKGTREQLLFALEAAIEAAVAPEAAYLAEFELLTAAQDAFTEAKQAYLDYVDVDLARAQAYYKASLDAYLGVEAIDFQISLGGTSYLLQQKANQLADLLGDIASLEASIATIHSRLADVTKYAPDDYGDAVADVIKAKNTEYADNLKTIDAKTVQIAEKERLADSYQKAIDILVAAYDSLSE